MTRPTQRERSPADARVRRVAGDRRRKRMPKCRRTSARRQVNWIARRYTKQHQRQVRSWRRRLGPLDPGPTRPGSRANTAWVSGGSVRTRSAARPGSPRSMRILASRTSARWYQGGAGSSRQDRFCPLKDAKTLDQLAPSSETAVPSRSSQAARTEVESSHCDRTASSIKRSASSNWPASRLSAPSVSMASKRPTWC